MSQKLISKILSGKVVYSDRAAKTTHGWETRKKRQIRAEKFREMKALFNSVNW